MPSLLARFRRAFTEFLAIPTAIVAGFVLLAVVMLLAEAVRVPLISFIGDEMARYVFVDHSATSDLMGTAATSIVTLTSITFSVLLLAVQQAGSTMTHAVFDQFLRRTSNQVYFGFFVGVALYGLVILAVTGERFNPVIGATIGLLLTITALMLLIVLIYSTVNQMRPPVIIEAIHDDVLKAWRRQTDRLARTRSTPVHGAPGRPVTTEDNGYVVDIDLPGLAKALADRDAEVVILLRIGAYACAGSELAELRGSELDGLDDRVRNAFALDQTRDIRGDPVYGIEQLTNIGWTTMSTAKQNPIPGQNAINAIRDLLVRFSDPQRDKGAAKDDAGDPWPIVYRRSFMDDGLQALEQLGIAATESLQGENFGEVAHALALLVDQLPPDGRERAGEISMSLLSGMGEFMMTRHLADRMEGLAAALQPTQPHRAQAIRAAVEQLGRSVGTLNARSTRVKSA